MLTPKPNPQHKLSVACIFQDGVVLQRDEVIRLWGSGPPGEPLQIIFTNSTYRATIDSEGFWEVSLPPRPAGGPFELRIQGQEEIVIEDVLVGDVWLLGGQSNMELPVSRTLDLYAEEVLAADNPWIRQFQVPIIYNFHGPVREIPGGSWLSVNPQSVLDFSALGYFFAQAHYAKYGVPVGLVLTAVGGTPIEAWMSEDRIRRLGGYEDILARCKDDAFVERTIASEMERLDLWYKELNAQDLGLTAEGMGWHDPALDVSAWNSFTVPGSWRGSELETVNGSVWFRKTFDLPKSLAGKTSLLRLGAIIDGDEAYLNGTHVGTTDYKYPPRKYPIPEGLLREGPNTIAVRVISNRDMGGFVTGKDYSLDFGEHKVDLTGEWRYKVGAKMPALPQLTFFQYKPCGVYNTMIAPLASYTFRGVLWYQGESNTGAPDGYGELFAQLIENWRETFGEPNLPFLFVQLPNFAADHGDWAKLRNAQRSALEIPHTGMVVTIDLGESNDLHPQNKKDIAKRLALCAQNVVFSEPALDQGPICETMTVEDGAAVLVFSQVGSGLRSRGGALEGFTVAGSDGRFYPARAEVQGSTVRLRSEAVQHPTAVRYAWGNNPEKANLYNAEGLPASPFEIFANL
ncbi:MAG: sialate O-acetylesterase [Limnochordia bacterium]|nr:sialate O-acetylesterase [Limnochordia bacterium]